MPPLRYVAVMTFVATGFASVVALNHMDRIASFILIAPGYLVQAWLFQANRALGGLGYQLTIIGVSAIFWTMVVVAAAGSARHLIRRARRRRAA